MAYERRKKKPNPVKRFFLVAILAALAVTAVVTTVGRKEFGLSHRLVFEALGPVQSVFARATEAVTGLWRHYLDLVGVSEENDRLRKEIKRYIAINAEYREAVATNVRLNQLLDLAHSLEQPVLTAHVIGRDPALWFKTITIDKGISSGVEKGMPVVTVEGVVGQVINVSPRFAKVLLATDPNSAVDAILQTSRALGIVKGNGQGYRMDYVLREKEVAKDDLVVTSGMGGVFPKGLLVGRVSEVGKDKRGMFHTITVQPAVDFRELEYVTIILKANSLAE
ncbi:MAG: rod shape-determining protein MreC [Desulfobacteraceae bacterium]|nr:rod shape-determining protein MreC [Desulfobacteraceae bacterium]